MSVGIAYKAPGIVLSPLSLALRLRQKEAIIKERNITTNDKAATDNNGLE